MVSFIISVLAFIRLLILFCQWDLLFQPKVIKDVLGHFFFGVIILLANEALEDSRCRVEVVLCLVAH